MKFRDIKSGFESYLKKNSCIKIHKEEEVVEGIFIHEFYIHHRLEGANNEYLNRKKERTFSKGERSFHLEVFGKSFIFIYPEVFTIVALFMYLNANESFEKDSIEMFLNSEELFLCNYGEYGINYDQEKFMINVSNLLRQLHRQESEDDCGNTIGSIFLTIYSQIENIIPVVG